MMNSLLGTIIGGLISAVIAWIVNHHANIREAARLKADADQKDIDRQLALRRDIYLTVMSDLTRFQVSLSILGDTPADSLKAAFPVEFAVTFARLETVAPMPLYKAAQDLGCFARSTFGGLVVSALKIQREQQRLLDLGSLADIEEAASEQDPSTSDQLALLRRKLEVEHLEFRKLCMRSSLELKKRMSPVVREIRRGLDAAADMREFDAILDASLKHAQSTFDETIKAIDDAFGTRANGSKQ